MNAIINFAISWLITRYTDDALQRADVDRIKRFISSQETQAISNQIKHERTRRLISDIAEDLSDNVIDWVVRSLLYLIRVTK